MRRFSKYYFPPLFWAAVIFYLSSIPNLSIGEGLLDKVLRAGAHVVEYLGLSLLLYRALVHSPRLADRGRVELLLISILLSVLYGVSDEAHQYFVPTRQASLGDLVLDSVGAVLGSMVIAYGKDLPSAFRRGAG